MQRKRGAKSDYFPSEWLEEKSCGCDDHHAVDARPVESPQRTPTQIQASPAEDRSAPQCNYCVFGCFFPWLGL